MISGLPDSPSYFLKNPDGCQHYYSNKLSSQIELGGGEGAG